VAKGICGGEVAVLDLPEKAVAAVKVFRLHSESNICQMAQAIGFRIRHSAAPHVEYGPDFSAMPATNFCLNVGSALEISAKSTRAGPCYSKPIRAYRKP